VTYGKQRENRCILLMILDITGTQDCSEKHQNNK